MKQTPSKGFPSNPTKPLLQVPPPASSPSSDMQWISGGTFIMGSDSYYPEEGPTHKVSVSGFWMDKYTVTNEQFQRFVEETGYVTVAERQPSLKDYPRAKPELLVPGSAVFWLPPSPVDLRSFCWWKYVPGANWRHPEGPDSSIEGRQNYPVVHIAYEDAETYAIWAGKELPTEAEWEFAARGGLEGATYVWGDKLTPNRQLMANIWLGKFPWQNLRTRTPTPEPIGSYPPNGYGLYDMAGNVWQWTSDWYRERHPENPAKPCCIPANPRGGNREGSYDASIPEFPRKVLKGGSFLCAANYCARYRPAARHPETVDTSTGHIGFRCVVRPAQV